MRNGSKHYDRDFKINTVQMVLEGSKSMKQIAEELDIKYHTLVGWKQEYQQKGEAAFPGRGKELYATEAEKEIAALKKQWPSQCAKSREVPDNERIVWRIQNH